MEKQDKSAEEYRMIAEQYKQNMISQWKTFLVVGLFFIAAMIALFVLSIAWFAMNKEVSGLSSGISAKSSLTFELASTGDTTVIDTHDFPLDESEGLLDRIGAKIGAFFSAESQDGTVTSDNLPTIRWNLSGSHHLANVEGAGLRDEMDDIIIGLQPGIAGELEFYIVPKVDGAQTIDFTVSLICYADQLKKKVDLSYAEEPISFLLNEKETKIWKITDDRINEIAVGHLFFFRDMEDTLYDVWCEPDENGTIGFRIELGDDARIDEPVKVDLYWVWPTMISEVVLKSDDRYLAGRKQLMSKTIQDMVIADMCDDTTYSRYFIEKDGEPFTAETMENLAKLITIHKASWGDTSDTFTEEQYIEVNRLYNNADQFLGKNVSYMILELSANGN